MLWDRLSPYFASRFRQKEHVRSGCKPPARGGPATQAKPAPSSSSVRTSTESNHERSATRQRQPTRAGSESRSRSTQSNASERRLGSGEPTKHPAPRRCALRRTATETSSDPAAQARPTAGPPSQRPSTQCRPSERRPGNTPGRAPSSRPVRPSTQNRSAVSPPAGDTRAGEESQRRGALRCLAVDNGRSVSTDC
jgi:hypothetical protein